MYLKQWETAVRAFLVLSVLTGLAYPFAMTGLAQVLFPKQAGGSLILSSGRPVGSRLIGQSFEEPRYFWGRLSATGPTAYNAAASSASNYGPSNPALLKAAADRIAALRAADPESRGPVPVDLVTSSASGLDPEISPAAANFQLKRVARARGWPEASVERLIRENTRPRFLGLLGEPGVNVLALNIDLDRASP